MTRVWLILSLGLGWLSLLGAGTARDGGEACRSFPETGFSICGAFLQYWQTHGGLEQQGYPISGEFTEQSELDDLPRTVQYFERSEFELHPENQPPYNVLLVQLGRVEYVRKYPYYGAPNQQPNNTRGHYFAESGHWVGGAFWEYWQAHGGLDQFGYPLTDEFVQIDEGDGERYTVQYFERTIFERSADGKVILPSIGSSWSHRIYPKGFVTDPGLPPYYEDLYSSEKTVLKSFYNAVNRKEYDRANSYIFGDGRSSFDRFMTIHQQMRNAYVVARFRSADGAAGMIFTLLSVVVTAQYDDGSKHIFAGCFGFLRHTFGPLNSPEPYYVEGLYLDEKTVTTPLQEMLARDCYPAMFP